jgi:hypothetical protein
LGQPRDTNEIFGAAVSVSAGLVMLIRAFRPRP